MQYNRNDMSFTRGSFRVRGDTVEIIPSHEELAVRIEYCSATRSRRCTTLHPLTGDVVRKVDSFGSSRPPHYVAGTGAMAQAIGTIEEELAERLSDLENRASCWRRSGCGCAPTTTSR